MSDNVKNCMQTNIPQVDNSSLDCDELVLSKCVLDGEKTQEQINTELLKKISDIYIQLMQIIYNDNSADPVIIIDHTQQIDAG